LKDVPRVIGFFFSLNAGILAANASSLPPARAAVLRSPRASTAGWSPHRWRFLWGRSEHRLFLFFFFFSLPTVLMRHRGTLHFLLMRFVATSLYFPPPFFLSPKSAISSLLAVDDGLAFDFHIQ